MAQQPTMKLIDPATGLAQCTACGATHRIRFRRRYKADAWSWYCLKRARHDKPAGCRAPELLISKETPMSAVTRDGPITTIAKEPPITEIIRQ